MVFLASETFNFILRSEFCINIFPWIENITFIPKLFCALYKEYLQDNFIIQKSLHAIFML